ncbi:MAG TPA: hypothetical protein VHE35_21635 [Kofleriaceae bacterium]|nr:hypothetical protein [Kofleriaceae bacterium]
MLREPGGAVDSVLALDLVDGRIAAVHLVRNPDKPAGLATARAIADPLTACRA